MKLSIRTPLALAVGLALSSCAGFRQLTMDSANRNYERGDLAPAVLAASPDAQVGAWVGTPPRPDQDLLLWFFRPN